LKVVGRMKPTGTPWDNSVIVPIEFVWEVHGLPNGHAEGDERIGPPFDAARVPGVPAIVVKPETINAATGFARSTARLEHGVLSGGGADPAL